MARQVGRCGWSTLFHLAMGILLMCESIPDGLMPSTNVGNLLQFDATFPNRERNKTRACRARSNMPFPQEASLQSFLDVHLQTPFFSQLKDLKYPQVSSSRKMGYGIDKPLFHPTATGRPTLFLHLSATVTLRHIKMCTSGCSPSFSKRCHICGWLHTITCDISCQTTFVKPSRLPSGNSTFCDMGYNDHFQEVKKIAQKNVANCWPMGPTAWYPMQTWDRGERPGILVMILILRINLLLDRCKPNPPSAESTYIGYHISAIQELQTNYILGSHLWLSLLMIWFSILKNFHIDVKSSLGARCQKHHRLNCRISTGLPGKTSHRTCRFLVEIS